MMEAVLIAKLGGTRIAIAASAIASVIELETLLPVPMAPSHIRGLAALRSHSLTVVDCNVAIGRSETAITAETRAVVTTITGHQYALIFDEIEDVISLNDDAGPLPSGIDDVWKQFATGTLETTAGPALLIETDALLGLTEQLAA